MNDTDKIIQDLMKQDKKLQKVIYVLCLLLVGCLTFIGLTYFNGMLNL